MPVRVSYKKQFTLMIMLLVVFLVVIEVPARIYESLNPRCYFMIVDEVYKDLDYFTQRKICDHWENALWYTDPISSLRSLEPNQHTNIMNINNDGFRGPEILKEKPDDTYRIFVLGGSTAFAIKALSDQTTIPGYLQENYDQLVHSKNMEVVNAAVPGYKSIDELMLVKTKLIDYSPDLIIVYDGTNDLHLQFAKNFTLKHEIKYKPLDYIYKKYFSFYRTVAVINGVIEDNFQEKKPKAPKDLVYYPRQKASAWEKNIKEICNLGKQNGWDTLVILQPFLITGNKTLTENEMYWYKVETKPRWGFLEEYQYFVDKLENLKTSCTKTANLGHIFDSFEEAVYFDREHIGYKSNKVVADEIFKLSLPIVNNPEHGDDMLQQTEKNYLILENNSNSKKAWKHVRK